MTDQKIELSSDTVLVKLHGGVTGITRRTLDEKEHRDGKAVETQRTAITRQADAVEAERAKKLLNQLRATVDKHCTTALGLTLTNVSQLAALRAEIAPIQAEIDTHNTSARYHSIDRSLVCAPIGLRADPAALAEVCRQIADELKVAKAFFEIAPLHPVLGTDAPANIPGNATTLAVWLKPVDNWRTRTRGLDKLFPTITGQMIGEALQSVADLRTKVADLARAAEKAGQSPESALRTALQTVTAAPGALGLVENAIGFTAVTDAEAKATSDAARAEGNTIEVH